MLEPVCLLLSVLLFDCCLCVDITYHVKEEQSPGTYVGDIVADSHLLDTVLSKDHSLFKFSQLQRREPGRSQLFNVTKIGKLYTAQRLDAESLCTYNIECFKNIKVAVRKGKSFMKILKIKVIIEDINDHQPEFPDKQFNIQFSEELSKGVKRSIPNAIDKDVGVLNSQISYHLQKSFEEPFSLSVSKRLDGRSKLTIILQEKLDRETKDTYMLQVIAKDGGSPPKEAILNVNISVTDVNDNLPVFSQDRYNVSIENTFRRVIPIVVLSATDIDSGKNGRVSYQFSPKTSDIARSHFKLNQNTGEIFMQKLFTSTQTYKLFVDASDKGSLPLSSTAIVLVNIINGHNTIPKIDVDFVSAFSDNTATISEDITINSFIAYVMITDNDVGQNGEVSCDIHHDIFQLITMDTKEYKIIVKHPVDRETQTLYHITIRCRDKGFPPLQSERKISIQVTDVNDVQPQFTKDTFNFLTYENEKTNFPIGFINASDKDLGPGGQLTYSLIGNNSLMLPFQITNYGFISTKQSLDRELQKAYKFQVFVNDNGIPSLNNTANVIVEILDKNDNAPYFTFPSVDPFTLDIHYHPQSKMDITVLRASDRDNKKNAFLRYEILAGNDIQLFKVNSYTGVLSFSRTVYQNDAGSYDLKLVVKDSGTPVLSATTTLALTMTVSNKTSTMLTAVSQQSESMINVTLVIIIVAAAVIISVAIVISITLCIVRCNTDRNNSPTAGQNPPYQSRTEMRQLIYQANNPVAMISNPEEMLNRNTQSIRSTSELYPGEGSPNKWETLSPPKSEIYNQQREMTYNGEQVQQCTNMSSNYLSDTLSTQRDSGRGWSERDIGHYEEIPGMSAHYNMTSSSRK